MNTDTALYTALAVFVRRYMDAHDRPAPTVEIAYHLFGLDTNETDMANLRQQIRNANKELADLGERVRGIRNVGYVWEVLS